MSVTYRYTARTVDGVFVVGSLSTADRDTAAAHLRARALLVTSLVPAQSAYGVLASISGIVPVDARARMIAIRSFATLLRAGVPMDRALAVTIEHCRDRRLREAWSSVASDVEGGVKLSEAMRSRPHEFSRLAVAMVCAGELTGDVDAVLDRLATLLERDVALRRQLIAALTYPAIVCAMALGLVVFLVTQTVPSFVGLFANMHVALPATTVFLIAVGHVLATPSVWLAFALLVASIVLLNRAVGSRRTRSLLITAQLRIPVIGTIARTALAARLTRTLGTLLCAGIPLVTAAEVTIDVVGDGPFADLLRSSVAAIRRGEGLARSFACANVLDPLVKQLVRVGAETGDLDSLLLRAAAHLEADLDMALSSLGTLIEPVMMIGLGTIVGVILASVLIPLYSIIGSIK